MLSRAEQSQPAMILQTLRSKNLMILGGAFLAYPEIMRL